MPAVNILNAGKQMFVIFIAIWIYYLQHREIYGTLLSLLQKAFQMVSMADVRLSSVALDVFYWCRTRP